MPLATVLRKQFHLPVLVESDRNAFVPHEQIGIWTGAENFAGNLAGIIAPLAIGLLIKMSGSYVPGFALGSIVLLVGVFAYWFIVGDLKP